MSDAAPDIVAELEQTSLREDRRCKHQGPRARQYVRVQASLLLRAAKEIRQLREKTGAVRSS
jgi:hypothetical protein